MGRLYLYSIFHLNLAFSLIPEEDYTSIIENSYWPLLELAEEGIPLGIEASAHTLKEIERRDRGFVRRLRELWEDGSCEFVGSGHSQIIMPLVPAHVNRWNLEIGNGYYRKFLGKRPHTALVGEQTFSKGLVRLFREAGYSTIIMDWSNCYRYNQYPKRLLYYPQMATGIDDEIRLLWNHSIAFQKFQRCIYRELSLKEYVDFIMSHQEDGEERAFIVYGNDAEVFGYRPGVGVSKRGEYERVREVFRTLVSLKDVELVTPSAIVEHFTGHPMAYRSINLESVETPIVCKKQDKYNPLRWAVSGRDNVHINSACYRVYENMRLLEERVDEQTLAPLKEALCELWGSDFRTNTIDEKFLYFRDLMGWLKHRTERLLEKTGPKGVALGRLDSPGVERIREPEAAEELTLLMRPPFIAVKTPSVVRREDNLLTVRTPAVEAEFLENKGLAMKSTVFTDASASPLVGTLPHGYYEDIQLGADFFSAHLIHIAGDGRKTTDLSRTTPVVEEDETLVRVSAEIPMDTGTLWKDYRIWKDEPRLDITYKLRVKGLAASSLRLGIFTFIPEGFHKESLWYETVNGGTLPERFYLAGHTIRHDEPVNYRVSARSCLGATEGWVRVGDREKCLEIWTDKAELYSVPLVHYRETDGNFFFRIYHSVGEMDETAWWTWRGINRITFTLKAHKRHR